MQQNLTELATVENQINTFFQNHCLGNLLRQCGIKKEKGVSLETLFQFLFALAFTGKNLFRNLEASGGSCDGIFKDAAYRFQNSIRANWRRFLLLLSSRIIVTRLESLTEASNRQVLIVDDTLFLRDRSKHVELLSRVHDHNTGRYHKGFRMLTMGWSDGCSFVPMLFSMLSSSNEKNRLVPMRDDIDKRTNGYKRRQESLKKSTDVLVDLVTMAMSAGIKARHLLFDSWFAFPSTIRRIRALGMDVVCMLKDMPKTKYTFGDKQVTLSQLFKLVQKRFLRSDVLASCLVSIGNDENGMPVSARIVFIRDRKSRSWLALLSTDTTLTAEEIVQLYKRRWDIETFFKISKSFLKLAKECQSLSYDAIVAHATMVCCRYIMLETNRRMTADPRTLGTLFHATCDEIQQTSFTEALGMLLKLLEQTMNNVVGFSKEQVEQLTHKFIEQLPEIFRRKLLFSAQT